MKLSEYIENNDCLVYEYTGTIWGDNVIADNSNILKKDDVLALLTALPDFDDDILDVHPVYGIGRKFDEDGWMIGGYYLHGDKIGYSGHLTDEIVLVEKNF